MNYADGLRHSSSGQERGQEKKKHITKTHEVHPDGGDVALRVRVIRKPQQQTRLSHARVSDQQQLKQVVTAEPRAATQQ